MVDAGVAGAFISETGPTRRRPSPGSSSIWIRCPPTTGGAPWCRQSHSEAICPGLHPPSPPNGRLQVRPLRSVSILWGTPDGLLHGCLYTTACPAPAAASVETRLSPLLRGFDRAPRTRGLNYEMSAQHRPISQSFHSAALSSPQGRLDTADGHGGLRAGTWAGVGCDTGSQCLWGHRRGADKSRGPGPVPRCFCARFPRE